MKYKKTYSSDRSNNNKINIGRARGVILLNFKIFVCMCTFFLKFVKNFSDSHVNKSAIYTVSKCEHVVVARSLFEKKNNQKEKKICSAIVCYFNTYYFFHRHYRMVCCWFLLICDSARVSSISVNVRIH